LFRKLGELANQIEARVDKAVKFEPSDLEAERDRVKTRLEEVEQEIIERQKPPEDPMRAHFKKAETVGEAEAEGPDLSASEEEPV
jgi:hypothetical protein